MQAVVLSRDGSLVYEGRPITSDSLGFLSYEVKIEEGYALRSLFSCLRRYPVLLRLHDFWPSLLEQAEGCPARGCVTTDFDGLEFAKTIEMIGHPDPPRMEVYNSLHGIQSNEKIEIRPYHIQFFLDMELSLGKLRHVVFGDRVDTFVFDTVYNLFELLDGIAWELSFHGMPVQCKL